jgi:outer membrane immunogenic protein
MKKTIVVGLALAALMAPPVVAAELPVKAPPPPPAPVYTWTGCYIGANVGLVGADTKVSWDGVGEGGHSQYAMALGGHLGCDYQVDSNWVVGVRGLMDKLNFNETRNLDFV